MARGFACSPVARVARVGHASTAPPRLCAVWRDDEEVQAAKPGENLKLRIQGIDDEDVQPGFVVCSKANPGERGGVSHLRGLNPADGDVALVSLWHALVLLEHVLIGTRILPAALTSLFASACS